MKKMTFIALMLNGFTLLTVNNGWASPPEIKGDSEWSNQYNSVLKLSIEETGAISGTFTTAVGCGASKPRKVIGTMNGLAISFTVNFEECESVTAWNGHLLVDKDDKDNKDKQTLSTLWHLTIGKGPVTFASTLAGADVFKRNPDKKSGGCRPGSLALMGVGC